MVLAQVEPGTIPGPVAFLVCTIFAFLILLTLFGRGGGKKK